MDTQEFEEFFFTSLERAPSGSMIRELDFAQLARSSYLMDLSSLQDSFRFRSRYLGRKIATLLIDEKGNLQKGIPSQMISFLKKTPFCLGPRKEGDSLIYAHLLDCCSQLEKQPGIWALIQKFSTPLCHKRAEEVIRETLWPTPVSKVETVHVRRAVLAAWLTFLRQTVGSCFVLS